MNKLRRFYNQNSRGIWTLAIIIAFFLILLRLVNLWTAKKSTEELTNNQIKIENSVIKTENNINLESELSGITGEKKSSTIISTEVKIIQEFLNNCEKKDTEKAYDMLTEECKDEMYDTEEKFKEQYCNNNFKDDNMNFNIENWINSTYKVKVFEDIMATGKYEDRPVVQDYITVKKEGETYKLNINNYIGRSELNKEKSKDGVKIKIINRNIYMDYESYEIEVKNNTEKDILMDTKENLKSMYIKDSKDVKYSAYSHEISFADLYVQRKQKRTLKLKYYSSYNSAKNIEKLVFSNVVMDYNRESDTINSNSIQKLDISI